MKNRRRPVMADNLDMTNNKPLRGCTGALVTGLTSAGGGNMVAQTMDLFAPYWQNVKIAINTPKEGYRYLSVGGMFDGSSTSYDMSLCIVFTAYSDDDNAIGSCCSGGGWSQFSRNGYKTARCRLGSYSERGLSILVTKSGTIFSNRCCHHVISI